MSKLTEDEVKQKLQIDDFRHIKKDQLIEFVSSIPDMDKETAIKCIEQFPNFKEYSNTIVDHFYSLCKVSMIDDGKETIKSYELILDDLSWMLKKDDISENMHHYIIEQMVLIGNKIEETEDKKRNFKHNVIKAAGAIGAFAMSIGGALLGVRISKK